MAYTISSNSYDKYFELNYLLKHGYFDFKLKNSIKYRHVGYMQSNLVFHKIFNTNDLTNIYSLIESKVGFNSNKETVPIRLSIYKNEEERRIYKLPNMYSYISLCRHLTKYKNKYIKILDLNTKSLSKEFYSSSFLSGQIKREENRIGKKRILKTDIQNFYPSIYTHSIPWVLVGKNMAKKNKGKKTLYYNELDSLIQDCQQGETHGIPTGSFASRLIAEIYMCKIDEKLNKYSYVRYVDDIEFPFNDESEKNTFYKDLNKELNNLNLKIKIEKTKTDIFPFENENGGNSSFFFDYFLTNDSNIKNEQKRIHRFIQESIDKERQGFKGALKLMFKSLQGNIKSKKIDPNIMTKPMYKKLFNLVLMKPNLSVYFLEFVDVLDPKIINNQVISSIKEIETQIQFNINTYLDLNYNEELYSLLSIFYYLNILSICSRDQLLKIIEEMDDLSSILAFELLIAEDININDSLFNTIENKLENSLTWEEEYWLFKYHLFLRINEDKKSIINQRYKEYLFNNYNDLGLNKSNFFNQKNFKKIETPLNLFMQNRNSNPDITKFFNVLIENNVHFLNKI